MSVMSQQMNNILCCGQIVMQAVGQISRNELAV